MEITPDDVERLSECSSGQFIEIRTLSSGCRSILQGMVENSADWHCLRSLNAGNVLDVERLIVGRAVSFSPHELGIPKALKPTSGCQCRAKYRPDGSMGWFHIDGTECNCERLSEETRVVLIASIRITAIGAELLDSKGKDKPGPEFSPRKDAKAKYFKVWDYVSKPGNSAKSNLQIAESTSVDKTMVGRILSDTRPPTADEIEPKRTAGKKR